MSHPKVPDPTSDPSWEDRFADKVAGAFGSMRMFYLLVVWQIGWMTLAMVGAPLLKSDPYPFTFCLFLSNLIQLWALPVLGTATNRADEKRAVKAQADHEALTHIAHAVDDLTAQLGELRGSIPTPRTGRTRKETAP